MSDSDDDNIVRYGTPLEPYEEDCTRSMKKARFIRLSNPAKKRFRKLLAANVNVNKARELSQLQWGDICKMIPALKAIAPENPNPPYSKKHNLKSRLRKELREHRSRQEPDQAPYWFQPHDARHTTRDRSRSPNYWGSDQYNESSHRSNKDNKIQGSSSHQPYREKYGQEVSHNSERNYWKEAVPSQARGPETNCQKQTYNREVSQTSEWNYMDEAGTLQTRGSETNWQKETYNKEVSDTSERNYKEDAGPSHADYKTNLRKRRLCESELNEEPPYRFAKDSQVDGKESNSWERDRSPRTRARLDPVPIACSSKHSYECTQLEYIDFSEDLQVKVKNGTRAVKCHYNESNNEKPFSDQLYNTQRTSSEGGASFNYWSEPERPSRLGLRNETHPSKHASTSYSYSEDKKFREDPRNYQKISWENSVNIDYRESDRPSRDGLRNETHPMAAIYIEDSDEENRGHMYESQTPVEESDVEFDFGEPHCEQIKSEKGSHRTQPSETHESFENKDGNENKDAEPIRVGVRNITAMTKTQMTLVNQAINQAIVRIGVQDAGPKFSGSTFKTGWILMVCENYKSRKWLEKKVPFLKPWPEANLSVTLEVELPKPITLSILILDTEGITVATALELLRVQNPGLETNHWEVCKVRKTYSGQVVHLSVDQASFEALKLINFKANLGTDKVTFWIRSGPGIRGGLVKPSEDIPLSPSLCAYTERQSIVAKSCDVVNLAKKGGKKRRRKFHRNDRLAVSQSTDIKLEMAEVKESKSPPPEAWHSKYDQSYSSSDWVTF